MEFFSAIPILDANLLESNIPEDDYALYNPAATVGLGDLRMFLAENIHRIYRSVVDGNTGHSLDDTDYWRLVNTTNRHRMFDDSIVSQSEMPDLIRFKFGGLGRINSIFLGNIDATNVQIIIRDAAGAVQYDKTFETIKRSRQFVFYDFFFGDRVRVRDLYIPDLPYFLDQTVEIIINKPGGIAKLGVCVPGKAKVAGDVQLGLTMGIDDYSVKKVDEAFGYTQLLQRDYRKYNDMIVEVPSHRTDEIFEALSDVRGTFCVFIGTRKYTSTQVFGFFESMKIVLEHNGISYLHLSVKGIT